MQRLLCGAVVLDLEVDHLLEGVVRKAADGDQMAIDCQGWGLIDVEVFSELDAGLDCGLGLRGLRAGFDLLGGESSLGDGAVEGEGCAFVCG